MQNTSLCYIEKDGKYLMLHRIKKENDVNRDKWIGVGGRFEEGESPEECATREIFEETGLRVKNLAFRAIVTFDCPPYPTDYMHLFTATEFEGEIKECDEGRLEWVDKSRLRELDLWEGDYYFFDLLDKNEPFFSMKLSYRENVLTEVILNGEKIK
ncbi:MAG: 8-oxo-dGTP diphosphatase [Oscillospiraceae bacterium]|nr:8-oxo-dGTP diphosphatase [Oscillospiraceae bacterium]